MSYLFKRIHDLLRKGQSDQFEDLLTELFAEFLEDEDKLQSFAGTFFKWQDFNAKSKIYVIEI